ncbi:MAG TPA: metalloregulator ArsR/SmtB family transcription factor [Candidatus Limnocylindria bacterium]|nr:metalloregulator ArsR/SmtB family transcription factor [Candidatus Limnocylindria bacterium]
MQATFSALAEPNRLQIIQLLRQKPLAVGEIVDQLGLRQPQVSKHLRVLSDAGLVEVRPVAQQRIYALRSEPLKELDTWLEQFRRSWDDRFDRFDDVLREQKEKREKRNARNK